MQGEATTFTHYAFDRHRPAHGFCPFLHEGESQASTTAHIAAITLAAVETFPDMPYICWRNAFTRIFHLQYDSMLFRSQYYSNNAARWCMTHTVVQQIA